MNFGPFLMSKTNWVELSISIALCDMESVKKTVTNYPTPVGRVYSEGLYFPRVIKP